MNSDTNHGEGAPAATARRALRAPHAEGGGKAAGHADPSRPASSPLTPSQNRDKITPISSRLLLRYLRRDLLRSGGTGVVMSESPDSQPGPFTDADDGDAALYAATYDLLRGRARRLISTEAPGHTLQATALVHEAYLRLAGTDEGRWQSRAHFLAVASRAMRRVLIDHARTRSRHKRGRGWDRVTLHDGMALAAPGGDVDLLDMIHLDDALRELEREHARLARVAEMRLFGGASMEEIAASVGVSLRTVEGDWAFVRRWLADVMTGDGDRWPGRDGQGKP